MAFHVCKNVLEAMDNSLWLTDTIIWSSADLLWIVALENKYQWNFNQQATIFVYGNACKLSAFISSLSCYIQL